MRKQLLEAVLLLCPIEFRREYGDQIRSDVARRNWGLAAIFNVAVTGLHEHLEFWARTHTRAVRSIIKGRLLTIVTVLTLALALGANIAVASVLYGVLLSRLPYPTAQQLVFVQETDSGRSLSYPDAQTLAKNIKAYGRLAIAAFDRETLSGNGDPVSLSGTRVSANYFSIIGINPELGQFSTNLNAESRNIVISDRLWHQRFSSSPAVLGRILVLNNIGYRVIGVAPPGFRDPTPYGLLRHSYWLTIGRKEQQDAGPGDFNYTGLVRVHSGIDIGTAKVSIKHITSMVMRTNRQISPSTCCVRVSSIQDSIVGPVRPALLALYGLVSLVLFIACANVASLHFTRNATRESELAVIAAMGASPTQIASQLVTETGLLAALGGVLGILLAWLTLYLLAPLGAALVPRWENIGLNGAMILYASSLVFITVLVSGLAPALSQRKAASGILNAERSGGHRQAKRVQSSLVIIEIALTFILVLSSTVAIKHMLAYTHVDLGFKVRNLYEIAIDVSDQPQYGSPIAQRSFIQRAMEHVRNIRGVKAASAALQAPLDCCSSTAFAFPDKQNVEFPILENSITSQYFETLGVHLVRGRNFTSTDRPGSPCVAIVDQNFVETYFGYHSNIGARIIPSIEQNLVCTIVGEVNNIRENFSGRPTPMLYLPMSQFPEVGAILLRTGTHVTSLASEVRVAFKYVDPTLPPPTVTSYESIVASQTIDVRAMAILFGALAAIALLLAISGMYAITSYSIERRRREFAIRRVLGAPTRNIFRIVIFGALTQSGIGVAFGASISAVLSYPLRNVFHDASPFDLFTLGSTVILCLVGTMVASLIPAIKAIYVEPMVALRND